MLSGKKEKKIYPQIFGSYFHRALFVYPQGYIFFSLSLLSKENASNLNGDGQWVLAMPPFFCWFGRVRGQGRVENQYQWTHKGIFHFLFWVFISNSICGQKVWPEISQCNARYENYMESQSRYLQYRGYPKEI